MSFHVETEMVAPGKGPLAEMALKGSVARMLAVVTGEFVGAGEFPAAPFPVAVVRLLARMGSRVRPKSTKDSAGWGN